MKRKNTRLLVCAGLSVLALVVQVSSSHAKSPVHQVAFEAYAEKDPFPSPGPWLGTATITIEDNEYDGTLIYEGAGKGHLNKNSYHGFATATFDFGELGRFDIWERANTFFDIVETDPFYRQHSYDGINMITEGTGVFEEARGVFHLDGYTEYSLDLDPEPRIVGKAVYGGSGMIYGIEIDVSNTHVGGDTSPGTIRLGVADHRRLKHGGLRVSAIGMKPSDC